MALLGSSESRDTKGTHMRKHFQLTTTAAALAAAMGLSATPALAQPGTWTAVPTDSVTGLPHRNVVLLTDGTLLAQEENADGHVWTRFTPDATGSYVNGTWSPAGATQVDRRYFPFAVLRDGRFFIAGGEDLAPNESDHNVVEIYDPTANSWSVGAPGLFGDIGDVANQVLADGRIMVGYRWSGQTQVYDPATNRWTETAARANASGTEETWNLLPNGTVLDWTAPQPVRYLPSTNQWVNDTVPPFTMQDTNAEIGPGVFLYNGKLLVFSAFGRTALYTPAASPTANGTWVAGPATPAPAQPNGNPYNAQYTEDTPACIEVNGKVLVVTSDAIFGGVRFAEYDPTTNTIAQVPTPAGVASNRESFLFQMVALPSGQILVTGTNTNDYLYTPTSGPQTEWRPSIQSIVANSDGTYTLTGRQLNGLSQGASYGDEGNAQTNYPLVRFISGSTVRYARTFNHSTMGFATGSATVQTTFTLPASLPSGTYQVAVVANGIASPTVNLTVTTNQIGATVAVTDQWESGYCANVTVTNTMSRTINQWKVVMNVGTAVQNARWQANFTQSGSTLTATNLSSNGTLAPGAQTTFGFCTQMPAPVRSPQVTSASGS
jgi:hypothetical protein